MSDGTPVDDSPGSFYLEVAPDRYRPTDATTSPWDASSQHGGPPSALLATCIEGVAGGPGLRLARLTVDFLGPIPRQDFDVRVEVTRPGKRIRQTEATLAVDGRIAVRASAWHIATNPAAEAVTPPPRQFVVPALPEPQEQVFFTGMDRWGHGEAIEWRFVEGGYRHQGPAKVWAGLRVPVLPDHPITGLQSAVMIADSTNGLSNELPIGDWLFIPPTLNVTLLRHPSSAWVYLDARTSFSGDGLGIAQSDIADSHGYVGTATQPLLISPR